MRLGIKLLNSDATLNSFHEVKEYAIARGEDREIKFQLIDLEKNIRYIPASGVGVQFQILRSNTVSAAPNNTRTVANYGIDRPAFQPFSEDRSIWQVNLVSADTLSLISSGIKVTVTEGSSKKITSLGAAIRIIDSQDA